MMVEQVYKPSPEDINRIKSKPDMLKVSGDGVFATLQGEGVTSGQKAVFLRLHYCNLSCGLEGGWNCDTEYTWRRDRKEFWQEPKDWSFEETASKISSAWKEKFGTEFDDQKRVVVTGGEPLLQQRKIVSMIQRLPGWKFEFETNGTVMPLPELSEHQINCSPKLANSGNSLSKRFKPQVLSTINSFSNSWFKFVVSDVSDIDEIKDIVAECKLNPNKILIMPEGRTVESVQEHYSRVENTVSENEWQMTNRNQLVWFGPKRRT